MISDLRALTLQECVRSALAYSWMMKAVVVKLQDVIRLA